MTCSYPCPPCAEPAVGACVGCAAPVCDRHAAAHYVVRPFPGAAPELVRGEGLGKAAPSKRRRGR